MFVVMQVKTFNLPLKLAHKVTLDVLSRSHNLNWILRVFILSSKLLYVVHVYANVLIWDNLRNLHPRSSLARFPPREQIVLKIEAL